MHFIWRAQHCGEDDSRRYKLADSFFFSFLITKKKLGVYRDWITTVSAWSCIMCIPNEIMVGGDLNASVEDRFTEDQATDLVLIVNPGYFRKERIVEIIDRLRFPFIYLSFSPFYWGEFDYLLVILLNVMRSKPKIQITPLSQLRQMRYLYM